MKYSNPCVRTRRTKFDRLLEWWKKKDQGQLAVAARRTDKASQDTHGPGRIDQEIRCRRGRNKIVGHMSTIIAMPTSSGRTRTG
jgi:hypothetical protein